MSAPTAYHCSVPFWRKSKINGRRCVPILMRLEDGRLVAHDRTGELLFDVAAAATRGRLTRLGTLVLGIDGRTYDLVGRGSSVSPTPTAKQREAVAQFWSARPVPPATADGGPGTLDDLVNGAAAWHMRTWRNALFAAGAAID